MSQILDAIDERIDHAEQDVTHAKDTVRMARDLRLRVEADRRRARGEMARGAAEAFADLDRLTEEDLGARRAGQDAELALNAAQEAVPPLKAERQKAEVSELAAHLAPLLDVQSAQAGQVEATLELLAAQIGLYRATCHEVGGIATLLGIPAAVDTDERAGSRVARRLMVRLSSTLRTELQYSPTRGQSVVDADRERTTAARAAIEKLRGGAASA